jgi:hypothetical protein
VAAFLAATGQVGVIGPPTPANRTLGLSTRKPVGFPKIGVATAASVYVTEQ